MSKTLIFPPERGADELWLTRAGDGSLALSLSTCSSPPPPPDGGEVLGIRDGTALYESMERLLAVIPFGIDDNDFEAIATKVAFVASDMVPAFRAGHIAAMRREEAAAFALRTAHETALAPFRTTVEAYVERFPDDKQQYPGAGYVFPSRRTWARRYIEQYVLSHGKLPTGVHHITLKGYNGGSHDFTELAQLHPGGVVDTEGRANRSDA